MAWEHPPETVHLAEQLYCLDRLTMRAVAERCGVADSTLWRWADAYGWRTKRERYFQEENSIKIKTLELRRKLIENCLETMGAMDAFAVAKMEEAALKAREMALKEREAAAPATALEAPKDPWAALEEAVHRRLATMLADPGQVDFRAVSDIKKALELLGARKQGTKTKTGGLTNERMSELLGKLGVATE